MKTTALAYKNRKGYAAIIAVLAIASLALISTASISATLMSKQKVVRNALKSAQSYYAAESGVEDALLRIINISLTNPPSSYTVTVDDASAQINITENNGAHTIQSQGNADSRERSIKTVARINTDEADFHFGVQATTGGILMDNNSIVDGNIYSNGSIIGSNGASITGDVVVAGDGSSGNKIDHVSIGGDAFAPNLSNCTVAGNATYVTGGSISNCDVTGSKIVQSAPIESADMPITQETIDGWKQDAISGGAIASGDYTPPAGTTQTIGPGVIAGNMILGNNQTIVLNGTVYVQGHVDIQNGAAIRLASEYGSTSGVLLADGWIEIKNNGIFAGSGQTDSYVMLLSLSACDGSTATGCSSGKSAVEIHNNAEGAIFYAANGLLTIHNNVHLTQATGWKIFLDNNAVVNYQLGLESTLFSGGPGASYAIDDWKEIQ